jgi:hypothetical protein
LASGLVLIAVINTVYWDGVYEANLDHMQNVRIAAARFVCSALPPGDRCAASDVGAIRYYSQRPIVDLGGLIDPNAGQWFSRGEYDRYLIESGVTYLILPGRIGAKDEGWFDVAEVYGFSTTPLFGMDEVVVFEIDRERWLQGYLPTNNYQATVAIYRLSGRSTSGG